MRGRRPFVAWAAKYGVNVSERSEELMLHLGEFDGGSHREEVRRILREGLDLWEQSNRDPAVYRSGHYRYHYQEREHDLRSAQADHMTRTVGGQVWKTLR